MSVSLKLGGGGNLHRGGENCRYIWHLGVCSCPLYLALLPLLRTPGVCWHGDSCLFD